MECTVIINDTLIIKRKIYQRDTIWYYEKDDEIIPHRDDGPAQIKADGRQFYYQHGDIHRDFNPAEIHPVGYVCFWQHGQRHRDDGPTIIWEDGRCYWYLKGDQLTFKQWCANLKKNTSRTNAFNLKIRSYII